MIRANRFARMALRIARATKTLNMAIFNVFYSVFSRGFKNNLKKEKLLRLKINSKDSQGFWIPKSPGASSKRIPKSKL